MYLTKRALEGLKSYQYKPAGYTILDTIHTPFWNWIVQYLPLWLAPNLITLIGTSALVLAYLINAHYVPDFQGEAPRWVYFFSAFSVVFYCQLDCLDGKQARRTKSSSPLGQLFDHGCDALSVHLLLAGIACSLGMQCGWVHALGMTGVMFTWILAQWEEYHTSIMLYGNSFYGVLEANYSICLIHLITGIVGPQLWQKQLVELLPMVKGTGAENYKVNEAAILVMITIGLYQAACNIWRVFTFDTESLPAKERGHKHLGTTAAFLHLVLLVCMLLLGCMWLWQSVDEPHLCRAQSLNFGLVYGLVACNMIMAHMCKEPFQPALWAIGAMAVGAVNARLQLVDRLLLTVGLDALVLLGFLHYVLSVIRQICDYLDIYCLTIKKRPVVE